MELNDSKLAASQRLLTDTSINGGFSSGIQHFVNLKKTKWRFVVLFIQCYLMAANYYCLYSLNSVQLEIQKYFQIDYVEYNLLTSIYGIPNVILCFISGNVIHLIGLRASNFIFFFMILIGQIIVSISPIYTSYSIALIGRLIVGVGSELQQCSYYYIISIWFKNKEMALASSFSVLALRIGAVCPDLIIPYVFSNTSSLVYSQMTGILVAFVGTIFAILYNLIDSYNERHLKMRKSYMEFSMKTTFIIEEEQITWSSFKELPRSYWIFSFLVICMYGTFQPFNSNLNSLIRERFGYDMIGAGQAIAIPSFIIALMAPIFGIISDKHGHRGDILIIATVFLATSQIWMGSLNSCRECIDIVYVIFVFQIAYSFFISNIWAALRLITPKHLRGVGVGITNSLQNIGYFFSSMLIGLILDLSEDKKEGYIKVNYSMALMNATGLLILIGWSYFDRNRLNAKKQLD
eukprot:403364988